jgi:ADP-ribosyl-[dinitrogen reductase] hydrolase
VEVTGVADRYLAWWRDGAFDTGPTTAAVLDLVDRGASFADAAATVHRSTRGRTGGCNPAHRSTPLAMLHGLPDGMLGAASIQEAAITHVDPVAGEVAAATTGLCRALIRGLDWPDALGAAAVGRHEAAVRSLEAAEAPRDQGGFAPAVLAAAVWFVRSSGEFGEALERSLDFAGPANHAPVLVGAIAGARWGANVIQEPTGEAIASHEEARQLAERLSAGWR